MRIRPAASCALACAALLTGASSSAAQEAAAARVDTLWATVHGHRIAFFVTGDAAAPVMILEAGGASHAAWTGITDDVARFARVVTYDRPGYGLSESCPRTRSASVIAGELHEALASLGIEPPYVLGGWSLGGSFMRVFAAAYPDAVAGLVLIDPAPDGFYERAAREHPDVWKVMLEEQERRMASRSEGHRAEWAAWDTTMAEVRRSDAALRSPVILLTSTRAEDELQPIWIDEHERWARRMPKVEHILVEGAGHAIHRDRPEVVLRALRAMAARAGGRAGPGATAR
ncbi:MAG TPA: alpha/beta fold hydrolase [Gemmatimonadales bacterium]